MSLDGSSTGSIIVGVDGSAGGRAALCWAVGEARLRRIPVRAIHVYEQPWSAGAAGPYGWLVVGEFRRRLAEEARQKLEDDVRTALETAGNRVHVIEDVVEGSAAEVLVSAAADVDLLVVGSRGHGGFVGPLLGSVSQQCAHHAPCPVVIVPPAAANQPGLETLARQAPDATPPALGAPSPAGSPKRSRTG